MAKSVSTIPKNTAVFLLTGFNNWGKTHLIRALFSPTHSFFASKVYSVQNKSFCVVPSSNDDLGYHGYCDEVNRRVGTLVVNHQMPQNILSAFCPTKESNNNSRKIIQTLYGQCTVYMLSIEHKWCGHARLDLNQIANHYAQSGNVIDVPVHGTSPAMRLTDVQNILAQYAR